MPLEIDDSTLLRQPVVTVFSPNSPTGSSNVGLLMQSGALAEAAALQAAYAASKVRLFNSGQFPLSATTPLATLTANECTFSGYPAGGVEITAWNPPMSSGNGAQIVSAVVAFAYTPPETGTPVPGTVGGYWLEDSTGVVRTAYQFSDPITLQAVGDAIQLLLSDTITTSP